MNETINDCTGLSRKKRFLDGVFRLTGEKKIKLGERKGTKKTPSLGR